MEKFLIAGLGNPGEKYTGTRHNIGFSILNCLADKFKLSFNSEKNGHIAIWKFKGRTIYLLKPSTFMNLSGKAVRYYLDKYKIQIDNLLIISDDLHLPSGVIKMKRKGSDGGHNGHKDIIEKLATTCYPRLKFGIGNNFLKGKQSNYVLDPWNKDELEMINSSIRNSIHAICDFCWRGIDEAMKNYNNSQ